MKYWSIITLTIFLNFTALPGIAAILGWELPRINVTVSEEETHTNTFVLYEKAIPQPLDIHDFLKFQEATPKKASAPVLGANFYFSPCLSIFLPPPEA
ncbi:MAG: hypothetical protein L6262_08120 [Weeksellaceae bacterium]|nr:hypothetical protein [Weeksellaceae bacterium]